MKIIGISGGSGAGKSTTAAQLLNKLPNSVAIDCDVYMHGVTEEKKNEILNKIGAKDDGKMFFYNYFLTDFSCFETWGKEIKKPVIDRLREQIKQYKDKDYVIVDWVFLPLCDFYKECDYTVCVKTSPINAEERLGIRERPSYDEIRPEIGLFKPWALINRVKYTALENYGYSSGHVLYNNGDIQEYYKKIDELADQIIKRTK